MEPVVDSIAAKALRLAGALKLMTLPFDLISLIDGSGSISTDQFEIMKYSLRMMATYLNFESELNRLGAIQFSSQAYEVCELTNNLADYNSLIVSMTQRSGGTNVKAAFNACMAQFEAHQRESYKLVLLFTDGDVNATEATLKSMRDLGIHTVVIGISLTKEEQTRVSNKMLCTCIYVASFDEMHAVLMAMAVQPQEPPKIELRTKSSTRASFDVYYGESYTHGHIRILEHGQNNWRTETYEALDTYFISGLRPGTTYTIKVYVTLKTKDKSAESEPKQFTTMPQSTETEILKSPDLPSIVDCVIQGIKDLCLPPQWIKLGIRQLNVVLLGGVGFGKSSLVNTEHSIMNGAYSASAFTNDSLQTTTLTIDKRFLSHSKVLRLWDTYGWTIAAGSYQRGEFEFLLDGSVTEGFKEGGDIRSHFNANPRIDDQVHAIIVVYSMNSVKAVDDMAALKAFYARMVEKQYQPIVVLTKADLVQNTDMTSHLDDIFDTGVIDIFIREFCQASRIPVANVFPVVNYTGNYQIRDFVKEKLALNALRASLASAQTRVRKLLRNTVVFLDHSQPAFHASVTVERGSDMPLTGLVSKMTTVPELAGFRMYKRGTKQVISAAEIAESTLLECAAASELGFWEIIGESAITKASPNPVAPAGATVAPAAAPATAAAVAPLASEPIDLDAKTEISVFRHDNPDSVGCVMVPPGCSLKTLRAAIASEVVPEDFHFLNMSNNNSYVPSEQEQVLRVVNIMNNLSITIAPPQSIELSVILLPDKESIGTLFSNVRLDLPLPTLRKLLETDAELSMDRYSFLTTRGNPISLQQEHARTLADITKGVVDGEIVVNVRARNL